MLEQLIIKKILLRLFRIDENDRLAFNDLYFLDEELKELFKRLKTFE